MSKCQKCKGTGLADSGGVQPWGEPILIECDCKIEESIMEESRVQFQKWWVTYSDKCNHPCDDVEYFAAKEAWQASRAAITSAQVVAYQDHYGNAVSAGDFDGGEDEMHETAHQEGWHPLILSAGLKIKGE